MSSLIARMICIPVFVIGVFNLDHFVTFNRIEGPTVIANSQNQLIRPNQDPYVDAVRFPVMKSVPDDHVSHLLNTNHQGIGRFFIQIIFHAESLRCLCHIHHVFHAEGAW